MSKFERPHCAARLLLSCGKFGSPALGKNADAASIDLPSLLEASSVRPASYRWWKRAGVELWKAVRSLNARRDEAGLSGRLVRRGHLRALDCSTRCVDDAPANRAATWLGVERGGQESDSTGQKNNAFHGVLVNVKLSIYQTPDSRAGGDRS